MCQWGIACNTAEIGLVQSLAKINFSKIANSALGERAVT